MLDQIKQLLGLTDTASDDLLKGIITLTQNRLKNRLGGVNAVPDSLSYIVVEIAVARFNRIGSEGLSAHTVEGETMSWGSDDLAAYDADIEAYLDEQANTKKGRVRFL